METKLAKLKEMWAEGDFRNALKLAASWPRLGKHKDDIQRGWSAQTNPDFYRSIGRDPAALIVKAISALKERYDL